MIKYIFETIIESIKSIDITMAILFFGCFNRKTYKSNRSNIQNKLIHMNIYDIFYKIESTY